jgi:hypothetical protein
MGTLIAIAVLAALAWTAGYAIACWIWPFTASRWLYNHLIKMRRDAD